MKKLMISMLAMAAMVSCSSEGILDNEEPVINGGLVPIEMTAAIGNLTTKAAIKQETSGALTDALTTVAFLRADGATPDWTNDGTIISGVEIGTDGTIKFPDANKQYYPKDGSKANLYGYYPVPTSSDGNIMKWIIDGTQDIIISTIVSGDKTTTGDLTINFTHQLTQLKFNILAKEAVTGEKLKHIKVKGLKNNAEFDPSTANFTFTGAETAELTTEGAVTTDDISTTGIQGGTLLIEPATAEKEFSIEVATLTGSAEKTYTGSVKIGAAANTSYDVKLSISQQEVTGKATVSQWSDGGESKGEVI